MGLRAVLALQKPSAEHVEGTGHRDGFLGVVNVDLGMRFWICSRCGSLLKIIGGSHRQSNFLVAQDRGRMQQPSPLAVLFLPSLTALPGESALSTAIRHWALARLNGWMGKVRWAVDERIQKEWASWPEEAMELQADFTPHDEPLQLFGEAREEGLSEALFSYCRCCPHINMNNRLQEFQRECRDLAKHLVAAENSVQWRQLRMQNNIEGKLRAVREESAQQRQLNQQLAASSERMQGELRAVREESAQQRHLNQQLAAGSERMPGELRALREESAQQRQLNQQLAAGSERMQGELRALREESAQQRQLNQQLAAGSERMQGELRAVRRESAQQGQLNQQLAASSERMQGELRALREESAQQRQLNQQLAAGSERMQGELRAVREESAQQRHLNQQLAAGSERLPGELRALREESAQQRQLNQQLAAELRAVRRESAQQGQLNQQLAAQQRQLIQHLAAGSERMQGAITDPASDQQSSGGSNGSWEHVSLSQLLTESSVSGTSVDSSGPDCFMVGAMFPSKAMGELSAFLASLFGPYESGLSLIPLWLENQGSEPRPAAWCAQKTCAKAPGSSQGTAQWWRWPRPRSRVRLATHARQRVQVPKCDGIES